jgi:hypothetical protein
LCTTANTSSTNFTHSFGKSFLRFNFQVSHVKVCDERRKGVTHRNPKSLLIILISELELVMIQ